MTTPLFSTYSQGENRVTATFIAMLQRLSLPNMDRILGELLGEQEEDFNLVTFINQPQGIDSIPDAKIETGHGVWIETKIATNAVLVKQIKGHMKALRRDEKLIVLTPDDDRPDKLDSPYLSKKDKERIAWTNFNRLDDVVKEILEDKVSPPSEFEAFLLREFSAFLQQEKLITVPSADRVMVVPAKWAWQRYNDKRIYGDMRRLNLKPADHIAFYTSHEIKEVVPKIMLPVKPINVMDAEEVRKRLTDDQKHIVKKMLKHREEEETGEDWDHSLTALFLSELEDNKTLTLKRPIENDKMSKNGKRVAYIQTGAKYVTLDSLKNASKTSELIEC